MTTRIDQFSSPAAPDGGSGTDEINVWIIGADEEVIVIDPGSDTAGVLDVVGGQETTIAAAEKKFDSWVSAGPAAPSLPSLGK